MTEQNDLRELLERLDESNRQQAKYARWQCIFSIISALCCIAVFSLLLYFIPQVEELTILADSVLRNLKSVTDQLVGIDLKALVQDVDSLVISSQAGVEGAMDKLNSIDFEQLNQAIRDLAAVVEPLASFFNIFH